MAVYQLVCPHGTFVNYLGVFVTCLSGQQFKHISSSIWQTPAAAVMRSRVFSVFLGGRVSPITKNIWERYGPV